MCGSRALERLFSRGAGVFGKQRNKASRLHSLSCDASRCFHCTDDVLQTTHNANTAYNTAPDTAAVATLCVCAETLYDFLLAFSETKDTINKHFKMSHLKCVQIRSECLEISFFLFRQKNDTSFHNKNLDSFQTTFVQCKTRILDTASLASHSPCVEGPIQTWHRLHNLWSNHKWQALIVLFTRGLMNPVLSTCNVQKKHSHFKHTSLSLSFFSIIKRTYLFIFYTYCVAATET